MWDWVPVVFLVFKVGALGTAMFYAIKWHYDQSERGSGRAYIRTGALLVAGFLVLLLVVGFLAYYLSSMLGLDLSMP